MNIRAQELLIIWELFVSSDIIIINIFIIVKITWVIKLNILYEILKQQNLKCSVHKQEPFSQKKFVSQKKDPHLSKR